MIDIIISGIVAVLVIALCGCYLKIGTIKEKRSITGVLPKNVKQVFFGVGMIISTLLVAGLLSLFYDMTWVFTIKRVIVCTALWPISIIDYRNHIIPNKLLVVMLILRVVIAVVEIIVDFKSAKTELLNCLIAGVGILIVLCLMRLVVRDGIGFGDVKLFAVMGLFLGIKGVVSSLFVSFVVSFFVSIFLLISKRKGRKEQIAFAPSILVGTLLSVTLLAA